MGTEAVNLLKIEQADTLQSELTSFADGLPAFSKHLAKKLLLGEAIEDEDIDTAYRYLLEDTGLSPKKQRPEISIDSTELHDAKYNNDLVLSQVKDIEGVNALVEGQILEFIPTVTVIYGGNASGKTGYVRLLKKAFFSRAKEEIKPDIYAGSPSKSAKAEFHFQTAGNKLALQYPKDAARPEFRQFAVFDGNCVPLHLGRPNAFEFRPAGLNIFASLIDSTKKVEQRLYDEIAEKERVDDLVAMFEGESEIKTIIKNITYRTNVSDIKKILPLSKEDQERRTKLELEKARLTVLKVDQEKASLKEIKDILEGVKSRLEKTNKFFSAEALARVNQIVENFNVKKETAQKKGAESFAIEGIKRVGSLEWKAFIEAAEAFARQQSETYPAENEKCLLCHQPLSTEAEELLKRYWQYLQSEAEKDAKNAAISHEEAIKLYSGLNFILLPQDNVAFKWLLENYNNTLETLQAMLVVQEELCRSILTDLSTATINRREALLVDVATLDEINLSIEKKIKALDEKDPTKELEEVEKHLTFLSHKELLSRHLAKVEQHIQTLQWLHTAANQAKKTLHTRRITDKEKELSEKYFNQVYVDQFNETCNSLNANFGIEIQHTGARGTSRRQLRLRDYVPSEILSEGEQKVISLADFVCEMDLSEENRGLIFDDPVNSLDDERKKDIASLLVKKGATKQIIIFTHDLMFISILFSTASDAQVKIECHWVEKVDGKPGTVHLRNAPSYEKKYRSLSPVEKCISGARDAGPEERERYIGYGFAALRTCYEALVIHDLFSDVVQRFEERVSIDALNKVVITPELCNKIQEGFALCCRYMEGHSHSDKYAYKKPSREDLIAEKNRFTAIQKEIRELKSNLKGKQST